MPYGLILNVLFLSGRPKKEDQYMVYFRTMAPKGRELIMKLSVILFYVWLVLIIFILTRSTNDMHWLWLYKCKFTYSFT